MPKMGIRSKSFEERGSALDALFSSTQQRVLGLLFGQPERAFGINELIALTNAGSGAVQREIKKLVASDFIRYSQVGREKRYRANEEGFLFAELRSIVDKTLGVAPALQRALEPARERIDLAVLFGSVAKSSDTSVSDIDVLIVSDHMTVAESLELFASTEAKLGRQISPSIYTRQEFRRARTDPFLGKLFLGDHVVLMGDVDAI